MPAKTKFPKNVLLSFVGSNDAGKLLGKEDGAVLTVFKERSFDEVHLLWNSSKHSTSMRYEEIANHVKEEITRQYHCRKVYLHEFICNDVTDHNEIYPKLLAFCRSLPLEFDLSFTAAIASGTPSMQVCWILMAESGDFPLKLIRSNEPKFGKPLVREVRLGTGLPKILRLEEEKRILLEEKEQLLPDVVLKVANGELRIGEEIVPVSPIQFAYYRYFADRVIHSEGPERVSGLTLPRVFLESIIRYHKESFPDMDAFRLPLVQMLRHNTDVSVSTFRGNISKLNKVIKGSITNPIIVQHVQISISGKRHASSYGLNMPRQKIVIG